MNYTIVVFWNYFVQTYVCEEIMVKEYLQKTKDKLLEESISLKQKETDLQIQLKETIKMIQLLEEMNDPNIASFTPREVNPYNKKKIDELNEIQKCLDNQLNELKQQLIRINHEIDEINCVIKVARDESNHPSGECDNQKFSILEAQEKERQRIARDLHDSTVQNLTSLVHKSELCMKLMDVDPIRCKLELSSLSKNLRDIINETRNMIYDLRPMSFDDIGFDITVERYLDKIKSVSTISFSYKVIGKPFSLNSIIALTLLRVIQEGCSNAIKHSNASKVDIRMEYKEQELLLSIIDDGQGFDISMIPEKSRNDNSGFGLSMMRERIYLLSGKIELKSAPGRGFAIYITIPIL